MGAEAMGDLRLAQPLGKVKQDDLPLLGLESADGLPHGRLLLASGQALAGVAGLGVWDLLRELFHGHHGDEPGGPLSLANPIQSQIAGDLIHPGGKEGRIPELAEAEKSAEKNLLSQILRRFTVAHAGERNQVDRFTVQLNKLFKSPRLPSKGRPDQRGILGRGPDGGHRRCHLLRCGGQFLALCSRKPCLWPPLVEGWPPEQRAAGGGPVWDLGVRSAKPSEIALC